MRRREDTKRLKALRMQIRAGVDELELGDFTEVADENLDEYLEGLAAAPRKSAH